MSAADMQEAERFLTLLDEEAETWCFRCFDDNEDRKDPDLSAKLEGSLDASWPRLLEMQARGCGVYVVVNEGGHKAEEITRVRAVFADFDGAPLPASFDLEPHAIVQSSPGKWHAYWLVDGLPLEAFKDIQRNIAARYGSDPVINDLPRVMRLPGFLHLKGEPFRSHLVHESGQLPYPAQVIVDAFGGAAEAPAQPAASAPSLGETVQENRHADVLKLTLLLAQAVRNQAMTRDEAFDLMRQRRDAGRWSRHVPDDEIQRALDGALAKGWPVTALEPAQSASAGLAETIRGLLTPFSDAELEAAKALHPHAFERGEVGLFPLRELTIVGAPGREGKTTILVGILARYALGAEVAGLCPQTPRRAVILSAEDDRGQYARKLCAQVERLSDSQRRQVLERVIVPDLNAPEVRSYRQLVAMIDRHPTRTATVDALIAALRPMTEDPIPLGLIVIETASTWNEAPEDNPGLRALAGAGKEIAQALGVAVILVHHTAQAAANNLPTLEISRADIRGGTALTDNSRQNWLLVNLGSEDAPLPSNDARTILRKAVAPGNPRRIAALVCLDSSKSEDPPPIFMQWERSIDSGPRAVEVPAPPELAGKAWRLVLAELRAQRVEARQDAKEAAKDANVRACVEAVARLTEEGVQATVRAVSTRTGHGAAWAAPYLSAAVADGSLTRNREAVPRVKGLVDVYRLADSSESDE